MVAVMPLFLLLLVGGATQATAPPTIETLRARAQERMRQDSAIYSAEDLRKLEDLYQSANRNLRDPGAKEILQRIVKDFPKSNRAGSAILYLAQMKASRSVVRHRRADDMDQLTGGTGRARCRR